MDPMQLLYYQAPLSALMLLFVIPFLEPISFTINHSWTTMDFVSCASNHKKMNKKFRKNTYI